MSDPTDHPVVNPDDAAAASSRALFRECLAIYGASFVGILALALLSGAVGFIAANLYALVAAVFIGLPYWWMGRRDLDPDTFGLTTRRLLGNVGIGLVAAVITFIPFAVGQYVWEVEVRGNTFEFDPDHWWQWGEELAGEPDAWGTSAGAWVWESQHALHVGARSERDVVSKVRLKGDRPFVPKVIQGRMLVRAITGDKETLRHTGTPHLRWEVQPRGTDRPAVVAIPAHPDKGERPRTVHITTFSPHESVIPLHLGHEQVEAQEEEEGVISAKVERGLLWIALWILTQTLFIALPEEYFYRGYLQTRFAQAFTARRAEGGAPTPEGFWRTLLTPSNVTTSVLFGLGHLLVPVGGVWLATRFTVFFPSLVFGWLREHTGTITASVVYHACCNMMVMVMAVHYG